MKHIKAKQGYPQAAGFVCENPARIFKKTYRDLATGPTHHMPTPAAGNPAFLGLIKPTAKQEGRERNKAGGMRHEHSQRYGWLSSYRKETHSSKAFQDILPPWLTFIPNTATAKHPCEPETCSVRGKHVFSRKHTERAETPMRKGEMDLTKQQGRAMRCKAID